MTPPVLNIVADAHIWGAGSAFAELPGYDVRLTLLEQNRIDRSALAEADILLTRSSTKVGEALLAGTPVRFAATATIGDDHYDKQWLDEQGIVWTNAAGSSTGSVIEYMLAVLLELHARGLISLPGTRLGVIGVGRIGSRLVSICSALGLELMLNDPPRARSGEAGFVALERVQADVDVVTLHTPLLRSGEERTEHLIDAGFLDGFGGRGVINAARGACVDNKALLQWLQGNPRRWAVLDCWEGEPSISRELLSHPGVVIATPHIAGHSLDGKAANTQFVYDALCDYLHIKATWRAEAHLPKADPAVLHTCSDDPWQDLRDIVKQLYPVMNDHDEMMRWRQLDQESIVQAFLRYRRNYPVRHGWLRSGVILPEGCEVSGMMAETMGVSLLGLHP